MNLADFINFKTNKNPMRDLGSLKVLRMHGSCLKNCNSRFWLNGFTKPMCAGNVTYLAEDWTKFYIYFVSLKCIQSASIYNPANWNQYLVFIRAVSLQQILS